MTPAAQQLSRPTDESASVHRVEVRGRYSLAASVRFLEGFTPLDYARTEADEPTTLRLAFATEGSWESVGVAVTQPSPQQLELAITGARDPAAVAAASARVLSVDIDARRLSQAVAHDPVAAALVATVGGLRPVCFYTPYEAACWSVLSQRVRVSQASAVRSRLAGELGDQLTVAGHTMQTFPSPARLLAGKLGGVPTIKADRLRAVAVAAERGELDAALLRALPTDEALAHLQRLPGIGPFSAELILIRGAGAPNVAPTVEKRLHREVSRAYSLGDDPAATLAVLDGWAPFRSWVSFFFRAQAEERP